MRSTVLFALLALAALGVFAGLARASDESDDDAINSLLAEVDNLASEVAQDEQELPVDVAEAAGSDARPLGTAASRPTPTVTRPAQSKGAQATTVPARGSANRAGAAQATGGPIATVAALPPVAFPLDQPPAFYKEMCRRHPTDVLACSINARRRRREDDAAVAEAKALGLKLIIPAPPKRSANDYVIVPEDFGPSDLQKQLKTLKEVLNKDSAAKNAAAEREKVAAAAAQAAIEQAAKVAREKAEAEAKRIKAEADAKAKADAERAAEEARKRGEDEAAQKRAAEEAKRKADEEAARLAAIARQKAAEDERKAREAAEAKARADAEARARAEAAAAEAAKPKIITGNTPAGVALVAANSRRTLFINEAGDFCTGGCAPFWPPLRPADGSAAGPGVNCQFGVITRPDGGQQVTANGKPLFMSRSDPNPGTSNGHRDGNGFVIATC